MNSIFFLLLLTSGSVFCFLNELVPVAALAALQFFHATFVSIPSALYIVHGHVSFPRLFLQRKSNCLPDFFVDDRKFLPTVVLQQRYHRFCYLELKFITHNCFRESIQLLTWVSGGSVLAKVGTSDAL